MTDAEKTVRELLPALLDACDKPNSCACGWAWDAKAMVCGGCGFEPKAALASVLAELEAARKENAALASLLTDHDALRAENEGLRKRVKAAETLLGEAVHSLRLDTITPRQQLSDRIAAFLAKKES